MSSQSLSNSAQSGNAQSGNAQFKSAPPEGPQYVCSTPLNLYASPELKALATQAASGRQLRILTPSSDASELDALGQRDRPTSPDASSPDASSPAAIAVLLCEDDYPGWITATDLETLQPASPYHAESLSRRQISDRLSQVLDFARAALALPNTYLWGGTLGPDYDCSGLVQAAFASAGVWLPRDAYQQESFTQPISTRELQPGDLVFFGAARVTHVALSLGGDRYIHSSGQQGRSGIGIDVLSEAGDAISQAYYRQFWGTGRVMKSYRPQGRPFQC
ncbi:MAG: C40 family peptidase [Elainellaceae cyanobacterium]